jgi:hypothetical protein
MYLEDMIKNKRKRITRDLDVDREELNNQFPVEEDANGQNIITIYKAVVVDPDFQFLNDEEKEKKARTQFSVLVRLSTLINRSFSN